MLKITYLRAIRVARMPGERFRQEPTVYAQVKWMASTKEMNNFLSS